jgi:8-oxo-dGTP pyrophosphatase MutT (NUDIX family)
LHEPSQMRRRPAAIGPAGRSMARVSDGGEGGENASLPSQPAGASTPVVPRDAATIMLVRDRPRGSESSLEVCMLRRHLASDFVGGAYVFPGGKVDESDRTAAPEVCVGRSDGEASALLGVDSGGLAFWVAALRECFEEAGVLLAYRGGSGGGAIVDATDDLVRRRLAAMRNRVNKAETGFLEACSDEHLALAVDRVHYFSHWITPEPAPKRYDTRFFVAALPPGQVPIHDDHETTDTVWVRPAEALERANAGEFDLIFPTMKNLQAIGRFSSSDELLAAAAAIEHVPTVVPRVVSDDRGFRILLPGDPGYEEALGATNSDASGAPPGAARPQSEDVNSLVRSIGLDGRSRRRG